MALTIEESGNAQGYYYYDNRQINIYLNGLWTNHNQTKSYNINFRIRHQPVALFCNLYSLY